ncbi:MAG: hypothetical protein LBE59_01360 [Nevskiaceae bacterium]|jgi:hypothetical protein|nr:hypothetical protein [Nevskiaceae bacterium]
MANSDPHADDLSTTGERPGFGKSERYADWAARTQGSQDRHAAISRNLASWANYKSWSERMKKTFESDAPVIGKPIGNKNINSNRK